MKRIRLLLIPFCLVALVSSIFVVSCSSDDSDEEVLTGEKLTEDVVRTKIVGVWEPTHQTGHIEEWDQTTGSYIIKKVDESIDARKGWGRRAFLSNGTWKGYGWENNVWVDYSNAGYSGTYQLNGKIIDCYNSHGVKDMVIEMLSITSDGKKGIARIPLRSDPMKFTILTFSKVAAIQEDDNNGGTVPEGQVRQFIQGFWKPVHVSGYADVFDEKDNVIGLTAVDRDITDGEEEWQPIEFRKDGTCVGYELVDGKWVAERDKSGVETPSPYTIKGNMVIVKVMSDSYYVQDTLYVDKISETEGTFSTPTKSDPSKRTILQAVKIKAGQYADSEND